MSLQEIKNDYAIDQGYLNWDDLIESHFFDGLSAIDDLISHENQVMKIYAMECLKLASDNLLIRPHLDGSIDYDDVEKQITNENNIIK